MTTVGWVVVGCILFAGILTAYAAKTGAPFLPTPQEAVEAALDLATVQRDDSVIDMGAGDGRVLLAAAKRGAKTRGYELSPFLWCIAFLRVFFTRTRARVLLQDVLRSDISDATVVFLFLFPKNMERYERYLQHTLAPGTRVVSFAFSFPHWKEEQIHTIPGKGTVRLYRVSKQMS